MDPKTLHKISYGLYIVSSKKADKLNGQIVNTIFQVTAEPPQIAVCVNKQNLTYEYIMASRVFAASILEKDTPMKFIGLFGFRSGRDLDKFKDTEFKIGKTGAPIVLTNALAYIECTVINSIDVGTHTIFVGKLIDAEILKQVEPMTYEFYHATKHGKAPKTAPTYIKEETIKEETKMTKYVCSVCGYVYDPQKGDPDNGINPGTAFEALPDNWVCPVCGAGKDKFEEEK